MEFCDCVGGIYFLETFDFYPEPHSDVKKILFSQIIRSVNTWHFVPIWEHLAGLIYCSHSGHVILIY